MPRGRRGSRQRRTWPCPHRPPCQGRHRDRDNARPGRPGTARPPGAATDPGARLNLPVGAGRATAGTASTPAKQCVVTDRILRPPSFASPRRSPRASPCLTCLDTENALRPGNTPDPGEIIAEISDTLAHVAETQPNCNGVRSGNVRVDVNGDGLVGTLAGSNNWGTLIYGGGVVGGGASPVERSSQQVLPGELTWEQATKFAH